MYKIYCMAFVLVCGVLNPVGAAQKNSDIHILFTQLNEPEATNHAAQQILQTARQNPPARDYIIEKLPDMIDKQTLDQVWLNAVRLAGKLKASNSVPALIRALPGSPFKPSVITFGTIMSLEADPVGNALAEIGDSAVPALAVLLQHSGNEMDRWRAARILWNIDSPSSRKVMRDDLQHESDPAIKQLTEGKSQQ